MNNKLITVEQLGRFLSNLKEKYINSGGADWNAQEGEAGYIENKPDIDPVVWKYMCNPCIIKSGNKVPEELIGDFDEENQTFYFKYPYKNMYVVEFKGYRINLTEADVISIKANGCIENAMNEINIVNVEVWIDKDKEWNVEG